MVIPTVEKVIRQGWGYKDMSRLDLEEIEIIKQFDEDHKQNKSIVREILEYYPLATNNDFILYIEALRVLGLLEVTSGKDNFIFKIPRDKVRYIISPESVTRARRSLIQEALKDDNYELLKKIVPQNPAVFNRRIKREKVLREYFKRKRL